MTTVLFDRGNHRNVLLDGSPAGDAAVQANQHLIVHEGGALLLDPGGHKVYAKVFADVSAELGKEGRLERIFLSHQDPDVVAAISPWMRTCGARFHTPALWLRFVPHYGLEPELADRIEGIPDLGQTLDLRGCALRVLPAHFLHSPGNHHVYDPVSRILYTGDLGASLGQPYVEVPDFDAHVQYMEGFHRRYMGGRRAMRAWVRSVQGLEIDAIAPQHGAFFRGEMVGRFLDWCARLECGPDLMDDVYRVPA